MLQRTEKVRLTLLELPLLAIKLKQCWDGMNRFASQSRCQEPVETAAISSAITEHFA